MGSKISNWRTGRVDGYARVFNLVSIINIARGATSGRALATCTAVPTQGSHLDVCIFEAPAERYADFAIREARLQHSVVSFCDDTGRKGKGVMCTAWNDADYRAERILDDDDYYQQVGQYYQGALWRDDLLPVPRYLELVLTAHEALDDRYQTSRFSCNLMHHTFLGDGTRLDEFLARAT